MKFWPNECKTGDCIRVKIGSIFHYGIFVSDEEVIQFGLPPLPKYTDKKERYLVCVTDINVFSDGNIVEVAKYSISEKIKKNSNKKIVERARNRIGEGGYNIIHNNCEHFVNECIFGVKKSFQTDDIRNKWNKRPILDVYIKNIEDYNDFETVFPKERDFEIKSCKNLSLKNQKYNSWKLLEFACFKTFALKIEDIDFKKISNGKWKSNKLYFSISHTKKFVAVAVSNDKVGIDIENFDEKDIEKYEKLSKKAFTDNEINNFEAKDFIKLWTIKEAIYKFSEKRNFNPSKIESDCFSTKTVVLKEFDNLVLSICSDKVNFSKYYTIINDEKTVLEVE